MAGRAHVIGDLSTAARRVYEESGLQSKVTAAFWIGLYLLFALLPLAVIALADTPPGRDFWTELAVALGFVGLAMLSLQFALSARFRRAQAPYGMDVVLQYHRQIAIVAVAFILAHPVLLYAAGPGRLSFLLPFDGPRSVVLGWLALLAMLAIAGTSLWRQRLRLPYEVWRVLHGVLAVGGIGVAYWHALDVAYYLGEGWVRALWFTMALGVVVLLAYVRVVKPLMLLRRPWRVEEVREERAGTWTVALRADGHEGIRFRPGQFAWLRVDDSAFSIQEHPFTFASSALETARVEFGIKELGDWTTTVGDIEPGARAYIDGAYGVFTIDRYHGPGYTFIAGGIGITPMLSMLRTLDQRGDTRPVLVVYANQDWDGAAYREELERLDAKEHVRVVHVLAEPSDGWQGERDFVDRDLLERYLGDVAPQYQHFVCGPPPMMDAVEQALLDLGVPLRRVHMERFEIV